MPGKGPSFPGLHKSIKLRANPAKAGDAKLLLARVSNLFDEQKIEIIRIENMCEEDNPGLQIVVLNIRYNKSRKREEAIHSVMMMEDILLLELEDPFDPVL